MQESSHYGWSSGFQVYVTFFSFLSDLSEEGRALRLLLSTWNFSISGNFRNMSSGKA